jgi:FdhD protein
MDDAVTARWRTVRIAGGERIEREDDIAAEYPLTFRLDGEEFATIVCTPSDLEDLAVGFLASEGVIRTPDDLRSLDIDPQRGFVYAELRRKASFSQAYYGKRFIGSCCGKSRQFYFQSDVRTARTSVSRTRLAPAQCAALMEELQRRSAAFRQTGGVHNAALCTPEELLVVRADIGRHNALDKVYGSALRSRIPTADKIVAFSGRISSEVALKAAKIGVGLLLSKSAPTDLALKLADDLGITCVGFIRGGEMNVYTHAHRIV